ncbi:Oligopeptide transporter, putative [Ricinus communis]|uniref:Oligopeptide transporter, putative n=1 Tax=Ricinus communis TaxID=3988 RepID=B9SWQ1_RICCO|nr:Oligopeptide transporter, putative [Ricinus communis]
METMELETNEIHATNQAMIPEPACVFSAEEVNDSPIEQVRLTVPITDDRTLPCLTFRTWFLGVISCALLAFLNQFFVYRQNPIFISSVAAQIVVLPIGKLMAAYLPKKLIRVPGTKWSFSLNPGPFNLKEHVLITIFANSGSNPVYAVNILTIVKAFYYRDIHPMAAMLLTQTTQMLGYGWAGVFRKFLVDSPYMWWPANLVQVSLFRFLGSPLATPGFAVMNLLAGFVIILYIIIPVAYWTDAYGAKRFPIYSSHVFNSTGQPYDISKIMNQTTFSFIEEAYNGYSKVNLSILFVYTYGLSFAVLAATLSHVALFHGRIISQQAKAAFTDKFGDVHTRIMKKNYDVVPQWWFHIILIVIVGLAMLACEGFGGQLQLPYWGVLLAVSLAFFFTLPIGVIQATTNQQPGLNVITELIIGYMYPGKPLANVAFKTYGYISMSQAIMFISDFKLGHYMKVPPKSMFIVQLVGTIIASSTYFGTAWWLLTSIDFICHPEKLPEGSPWTCPGDDVFYNASIIWGLVGPLRMFGRLGLYYNMNYFFLFGLLAPVVVWIFSRLFPEQKWIKLINIPVILSATGAMPPARAVNYTSWFTVGIFFNFFVYKRYKKWWARHNYILSAGLDAGVAFLAILCYFTLQLKDINGPAWWGLELDDHCPLATCPTAPGIVADGCPVL